MFSQMPVLFVDLELMTHSDSCFLSQTCQLFTEANFSLLQVSRTLRAGRGSEVHLNNKWLKLFHENGQPCLYFQEIWAEHTRILIHVLYSLLFSFRMIVSTMKNPCGFKGHAIDSLKCKGWNPQWIQHQNMHETHALRSTVVFNPWPSMFCKSTCSRQGMLGVIDFKQWESHRLEFTGVLWSARL